MRRLILCLMMLSLLPVCLLAQDTSWTARNSGTTEWLRDVRFVSALTGWAVGDNGMILKSTNQGSSWVPQSSGTAEELHGVAFADSLTGLAVGGCSSCGGGVVVKTSDGGLHWDVKDAGHALNAVAFSSASTAWAAGCDGLILKSTDAGETWNQLSLPDVYSCLETIAFADDSTGWIGGYIPGILLKTTDAGGTWTALSDSIDPQQDIDAVHFIDKNVGWFVGFGFTDLSTVGVIKSTTDGGATWLSRESGTTDAILSVGFTDAQRGWAVTSSGTILGTYNGGATWAPESHPSTSALEHISVVSGKAAWVVGLDGTILRKDLGGLRPERSVQFFAGWNMVSVPMAVTNASPEAVYPGASSQPYSYTSSGYAVGSVLNNGIGYWLKMPESREYVELGTVIDSLTIALPKGWSLIGSISDDIPVGNIKQVPSGSVVSIYGYTSIGYTPATSLAPGQGYWIKCDQSCTITMYRVAPGGMPSVMMVNPLHFQNDELPPPGPGEPAARVVKGDIPASYAMSQNYPNPFNPSTTIAIDIPEPSEVTLSIFNVLGQEVATLVAGTVEPGSYAYQWTPGADLPSGVYLCKIVALSPLSAKTYVDVKKMLLMK